MSKIPLIMDLVSGLLLAFDFYPKTGILLKFHDWVKRILVSTNTDDLTNKRTIIFDVIISSFIFVMILAWAWYKGSNQLEPVGRVGAELGLFSIGDVLAWLIISALVILLKNMEQQGLVLIMGIIISVLAFNNSAESELIN